MSASLPSPSLRRRVSVMAVLLIGVLLLVLALVTDVVLGNRLEGQLRQRLADRATVASALSDQVGSRDLARRLEGDGVSVVITTSDGETYAEGPLGGAARSTTPERGDRPGAGGPGPTPPTPAGGPAATKDVVQSGDRLTLTTRLADGDRVTLLADAGDVRRTQDQVRLALVVAAAVVLAATALLVPLVVRRALRPLEQMTGVARSITAGDRGRRLHPASPDTDLGRTATAFDDAFDAVVGAEGRAVASEERLRGFVSDAAHELRTPLAGVQASAERVLREDPPRVEREAALLGLVRETRRAGRLVEDLLTMARIDQGLRVDTAALDLRDVVRHALELDALRHPSSAVRLAEGPALPTLGDADRLAQVLGNLLDNAHHAARHVSVEPWATDDAVGLDVVDDGPGVPVADADRVFDRLVRLDASRARHAGGRVWGCRSPADWPAPTAVTWCSSSPAGRARASASRSRGGPERRTVAAMDTLLVVGVGPVSAALEPMARTLGWECRAVDDLEAATAAMPDAAAVVVTSHHEGVDAPALAAALAAPSVRYVGAMGSRRTQQRRREWLVEHGVDEAAQSPIHGPAGLDIGADGPAEIALSILAELVATERGRDTAGSLRDTAGPIHPELAPGEAFCPPG